MRNAGTHRVRRLAYLPLLGLGAAFGCMEPPEEIQRPGVEQHVAALSGANMGGFNLAGTNLAGTNLAGTNLAGTNLAGVNMGGTNLAGANLAGTNLGGFNLAGTNLAGTNLAGTNLAGTNLAGTNLAGTNLAASNLGGSSTGTKKSGRSIVGTQLGASNLAGSDSGANIYARPTPLTGMLYSGEDLWSPKSDQCIVMGIGSTAFAKLLARQTANAKISVALGQHRWGFATSAGGPVALTAWEAVVWGDNTYCTFVLATAPGTAWTGVAGFIKAIFRWQAPPTQTMEISGIEASAPADPTVRLTIDSYTGMMDAGARWRAGT